MKINTLIQLSRVVVFVAVAMAMESPIQAAPKSSVPPSASQPLPDLKVHTVVGSCDQDGVVKVYVTIQNVTGTPTGSEFKTKVGARKVVIKTKGGNKTIGAAFGEHTTPVGFATTEYFSVVKNMGSGLLSVQFLYATVDHTKKVHEIYTKNNSKMGNNFNCP